MSCLEDSLRGKTDNNCFVDYNVDTGVGGDGGSGGMLIFIGNKNKPEQCQWKGIWLWLL